MTVVLNILLVILLVFLIMVGIMLLPIAVDCYVEAVETIKEFKRKRGNRK